MPRIWIMYLEFLISNRSLRKIRTVMDEALRSLPVTQHTRIWDIIINKYIGSDEFNPPVKVSTRLLQRYIQLEPDYAESVINFLIGKGEISSAVELLIDSMNRSNDESSTQFLLLVELVSKNSNKLREFKRHDLPSILRAGLKRYPTRLGELWNALSDYYIRLGMFPKAIEIYEEAMDSVNTVVDFSVIYDSYQNFLELIIETKLSRGARASDVEMDVKRLEILLERRPVVISSVLLRQNPNNVLEWIKRAKLDRISSNPDQVKRTFETAISTIKIYESNFVGKVSNLWNEYARWMYNNFGVEAARSVYERGINHQLYKTVDDLASVWVEYVLFELRLAIESNDWKDVLEITRRSISQYRGSAKGSVQSNLFKSVKLWHLAVDIETSLNGEAKPELVRSIYTAMMDLKVITPQSVLNYSKFEYDHLYFEKAFQVLEKGISYFSWPYCRDIWLYYLSLAVSQSKRFSTERIRDLFEQALSTCPSNLSSLFFYDYYRFESDRCLAKNAIDILMRAAESVPLSDRPGFWYLAIAETTRLLGSAACRTLFQSAVEDFSKQGTSGDIYCIEFCVGFCSLESKLGQIDRARAILFHGSQFANPNRNEFEYFWDYWKNFELEYGSEAEYKDMKRQKRLIEVRYSEKHYNALDVGGVAMDETPELDTDAVVQSAAPQPVKGIDISKLRQMAAESKQKESDLTAFIPSTSFEGKRDGYVFTNGEQGLGYYIDK
jgi:pre-mRNA-splicing factor SYF1